MISIRKKQALPQLLLVQSKIRYNMKWHKERSAQEETEAALDWIEKSRKAA